MFAWYKRWRRARALRDRLLPAAVFVQVLDRVPACDGLHDAGKAELHRLVSLFLHEKTFAAAAEGEIGLQDRVLVAINACLPVLNLGIEAYDDWSTVIVYPDEFLVDYEEADETGVVHSGRDLRAGESWERGPLVISLRDVHADIEAEGYNVVIHECAHQLDMRSGTADGCPPLHRGMSPAEWSRAFSRAYEDINARLDRGEQPPLDEYSAESPAECFAVFSEYFFMAPQRLRSVYPQVYEQMVQYYRQDPATR